MSGSGGASAADRGAEGEGECPFCLAPLPPFWDVDNRVALSCCGQEQCRDCDNKRRQHLSRAVAAGTFGREEIQLEKKCSLCRTQLPKSSSEAVSMMLGNLEKGRLPLILHSPLGLFYKNGDGVERNVEKCIEIWRLGAEKGDPNCQYALGMLYGQGDMGLAKSPDEAKRWLLAAVEQGHAIAEYCLAQMLKEEGNDATEYLQYLKGSASKGYDTACHDMGLVHYRGIHGAQKSHREAIHILTPSAERGHTKCMGLLGVILCDDENEELAPSDDPNWVKGAHWIRRAAEKGDKQSIRALGMVEEMASSRCFHCIKEAPSKNAFLRCSRCRAAWYCSKDCQVEHWKAAEGGHKQFCIKWCPLK